MKYARIRVTPDSTRTPRLFDVLAGSDVVGEARLQDWNLAPASDGIEEGGVVTMLFEVDGDRERFEAAVADARAVRAVDTGAVGERWFVALLVLEPAAVPLMADVFGTLTQEGLVVATPVVYREGSVRTRIVGTAAVLQRALDAFPPHATVDVDAVGDYRRRRERPTGALSDRQREAVLAARDLGYYAHPRKATHEDVAERLGCAPNTASEHLQKAEAKLLGELLEPES